MVLCEFKDFAITSDVIKRICTNFKNFVKFANFYDFETQNSRIFNLWLGLGLGLGLASNFGIRTIPFRTNDLWVSMKNENP